LVILVAPPIVHLELKVMEVVFAEVAFAPLDEQDVGSREF
jgi:hypothetical protein